MSWRAPRTPSPASAILAGCDAPYPEHLGWCFPGAVRDLATRRRAIDDGSRVRRGDNARRTQQVSADASRVRAWAGDYGRSGRGCPRMPLWSVPVRRRQNRRSPGSQRPRGRRVSPMRQGGTGNWTSPGTPRASRLGVRNARVRCGHRQQVLNQPGTGVDEVSQLSSTNNASSWAIQRLTSSGGLGRAGTAERLGDRQRDAGRISDAGEADEPDAVPV